jgi:aspartyl-tRNA(Asn)/glutamyl-tRNA(Gln) amidotransferase subunit A
MNSTTTFASDPGRVSSTVDDPAWSSCEQRIAASFARIADVEAEVSAWRELDEANAMACARALDQHRDAGKPCGPLHGVPLAIKDVIDVAGLPTRCQNAARAAIAPASADANLVSQLRQAGAVILGKAHTTEYAFFDPSPARNPHNLKHTPGGSSSGSAAAVAAGMAAGALGTQTVASVSRPAAYCGIAAFKPSTGALSTFGVTPLAPLFDTVGFFGWRVADAVRLFEAICPAYLHQQRGLPKNGPKRVFVLQDPLLDAAHEDVKRVMDSSAMRLREAGHRLDVAAAAIDFKALHTDQRQAMLYQMGRVHAPLLKLPIDMLGEKLRVAIGEGLAIEEDAFNGACARIETARSTLFAQIADADAVLWPAAPATAPEGLAWTGDPSFISPWTALGGPVVTVPAGTGSNGLPIGMLLTAKPGVDHAFTSIAKTLAAALQDQD